MHLSSLRRFLPVKRWREPAPVVAVVRLSGVIGMPGRFRSTLSLAVLAPALERAFSLRGVRAVALSVNSPGGSPVQSALIHKRVRALAEENGLPVYAFAEDVAASGGYWLALAGDEIFADESSIVGSIGVISAGFGFKSLIERFGVERRVHAQGDKKLLLDPFAEEKPEDVRRLAGIQKDVHESFKELVRARRDGRLKGSERKLFSGDIWTGKQALELGLVDGLGDLRSVMRERYGPKVKLRLVEAERAWLRRRLGLAETPWDGEGWAEGLIAAVEARAMWQRFGL